MEARCPDDETLAAFCDGTLVDDEHARIESHIDLCATCRTDLSALAVAYTARAAGSSDAGGELELVPGDRIGRFLVVDELGRGAMGVVAIAYDPELNRNVAIKMLRPEVTADLRDEARAMARLDHDNVVRVYDVGEHAGRLFVTMELVDGVTLRRWVRLESSWRPVLRAGIAAGRGLAAAHAAGVIHRDFKPDNVLCGPGERVRVTDFGLAGEPGGKGVVGTPLYMAPEIWRGEPATERSDQWSFAATVFEALHGVTPFTGETPGELGDAIQHGTPAPPRRRVPARVTRALARGLATEPAKRFGSLDALLDELRAALRPRTRWVVAAGAVAAIAATLLVVRRDEADPCNIPPTAFDDAWRSDHRIALDGAFVKTGRGFAADSSRRVADLFDDYRKHWLDARTDACVATRVRGDQSDTVFDLRIRCLDRRRAEVGALARLLATGPTPEMVDRAVTAARGIEPVDGCSADAVASDRPTPADPVRAATIHAIDDRIATVSAAALLGRVEPMTREATAIVEDAKRLGDVALVARATLAEAKLAVFGADRATGERAAYAAITAAAAAHDDRRAADAWVNLVAVLAKQQGEPALAISLSRAADAAVVRADSPAVLRGALDHAVGMALAQQGKLEAAKARLEQALVHADGLETRAASLATLCDVELRLGQLAGADAHCNEAATAVEKSLGTKHPAYGFTLLAVANVAFAKRDARAAQATTERALEILDATVGDRHVGFALGLSNLGRIALARGDLDGARRYLERALHALEALDHPDTALVHKNLGDLDRQLGHIADARAHFEQERALSEAAGGPTSDGVADAYYNLGTLAADEDKQDVAIGFYDKSLAIAVELHGERSPAAASALDGLGLAYTTRHDCKRGVAYEQRAVAAAEALYGKDHPHVGWTLTVLADCQQELGDRAAIANLERAVAIHDHYPQAPTYEPAAAHWGLARALWKLGGDHARALAMAAQARDLYGRSREPDAAAMRPTIDRWIAARR